MAPLVWLVTGTTAGFGLALVQEISARGDKVIATGRNLETKIGHLKSDNVALLELDIAANATELKVKFQQAWDIFGHIDVLVNNAGMWGSRTVEEAEEDFVQNIFNINLFAQMRLTQVALPLFREQGHGSILFLGSPGAESPMPFIVHYGATKAALTNYAYGLSSEVRDLGIKVMVVQPGGTATSLADPRPGVKGGEGFGAIPPHPVYKPLFDDFVGAFTASPDDFFIGDTAKCAARIVDAVKGEGVAAGKPWPLQLTLGSDCLVISRRKAEMRLKNLEEWEAVSKNTDREGLGDTSKGLKVMLRMSAGLE